MKVKVLKVRISDEYLFSDQKIVDDFLEKHEICKTTTAYSKDEKYWSVFIYYEELKSNVNYSSNKNSKPDINSLNEQKAAKYSAENNELNSDEVKTLESLKLWRTEKAKDQNLPVYFVATNQELYSIAKFKPAKKEELLEIKGFGKFKIEHYGTEILEILEQM